MLRRNMAADEAATVAMSVTSEQEFDIVLKPMSHPELGDIRIDENLFAIGRTEPPFDSYPSELVADLSRRHARIFSERGAVYIADLDSKNGTTVNGVNVQQKITRLRHGDEICFGGALSYRVQLGARVQNSQRLAKLLSLTLTPERGDLGLQPIVVTRFPFLISKADDTFARYKDDYPHQVNYISRRHAHIFLKSGSPFVEDLGSTNGTFVAGKRLDEHAVPLKDEDLLAFGGHHFVYKVSLQKGEAEVDPTVTKLVSATPAATSTTAAPPTAPSTAAAATPSAMEELHNADKTTFVAAADSFLDIFCVDRAPQQEDEVNNEESKQADDAAKGTDKRPARRKFAIFASELAQAFAGSDRGGMKRALRWGAALAAVVVALALALYLGGASEREIKDMLADGEYAQAATAASRHLEQDPANTELQALSTEALLKANVPNWLAALKARDFDRAAAILAGMQKLGRANAGVAPLVRELESVGNLEQFVMGRGGVDAPIRMYADEERIKALIKRWEDDTQAHQRAFATISSHVPEFKDAYALALSHLRKLQSDDSVYLAAIERLKTSIATELNRDQPEALEAVLKEYAEKYPRIGGMDAVREDLRQYTDVENAVRAQNLGALNTLLAKVRFATPPFQARFRTLASSNRFPPADVIQQYQAVSKAWRAGDAQQAFAGLQKMSGGPWGEAISKELEHKKAITSEFAALQKARGAKGYDERLLSFYGSLDADEDAYFIRAAEADLGLQKEKGLGRAQELLNRAQAKWTQYREKGPIEGAQRLEGSVSPQFRTQARLLAEAHEDAQQGMRIYTQLKAERPAQWSKLQEEISAEAELQRKSLQDLRNVLEPGLLKTKLALLGGKSDDERQSPKTAE